VTVQELHYAVDQGLQKVGSYAYDNFLQEEIDFWLNRAQERFIKDRAFAHSDEKRLGFVANQKRLDDLRELLAIDYTDNAPPAAGVEFQQYDLPVDYLYLVNMRAVIRRDFCKPATMASAQVTVPVRIVDNSEVYFHQQDPFARSQINTPSAIISEADIKVFQANESFILEGISMDYIRTPEEIDLQLNQTSPLAEHTHQEIVDIAVKNILEAIQSPRYNSSANELSSTE
jgi:hypothetical protein